VLHPVKALAGSSCKITHADGSISSSHFPEYVAPLNPFKNIGAMQWECNGHKYNLAFQGETFETEDQRNWTDASYKTFCTPLDKPFPVQMLKGDEVCQCVTSQGYKSVNRNKLNRHKGGTSCHWNWRFY
jgi:hypothetical protein